MILSEAAFGTRLYRSHVWFCGGTTQASAEEERAVRTVDNASSATKVVI
jgi:hypothetical protein